MNTLVLILLCLAPPLDWFRPPMPVVQYLSTNAAILPHDCRIRPGSDTNFDDLTANHQLSFGWSDEGTRGSLGLTIAVPAGYRAVSAALKVYQYATTNTADPLVDPVLRASEFVRVNTVRAADEKQITGINEDKNDAIAWDAAGGDIDDTVKDLFTTSETIGWHTYDVTNTVLDAINNRSGVWWVLIKWAVEEAIVGPNPGYLNRFYLREQPGFAWYLEVTTVAIATLTLVNDSHIKLATPTENYGADPVVRLQSNAAGTVKSRVLQTWTALTDLVPAGATIDSVEWVNNCSAVNTASAQPLEVRRVTRTIVEGTGTVASPGVDGVTWNKYDGTNDFTTAGGDFGTAVDDETTDANLTSPLTTGLKTYNPLLTVREAFAAGLNTFCLCLKRKTELTNVSNVAYDTKDNGTAPTMVITYTPAAAGGGGAEGSFNFFFND